RLVPRRTARHRGRDTVMTDHTARRVAMLLALAVLAVIGPIVAQPSAQPASRYALTGAIVDRHTVDITGYHLGVDHGVSEGRLRSDKPPGQPLLAAPFYAAGRALGLRPATYLRKSGDLGMWWVTFWSSVVPLMLLAVMIFTMVRRYAPQHALVVTS